jgi:predicted alpha/beta-hydrolase family hydrolase
MEELTIQVDEAHAVSGLLSVPADTRACLVLAPGAGAGMTHSFMAAVAEGLAQRRMASLRYQFPYMQARSKRPDRPALATGTVRAAVADAVRRFPDVPVYAGGKSFGGRMTSLAQAQTPLPGVRGLVFLGFPLHAAGRPSTDRAHHLSGVGVPMLFVQGTRDPLADPGLIGPVIAALGSRATLLEVAEADHSFHVPVRSGRTDTEVMSWVLDRIADWMAR